ncbi:MAG TPA: hypothetical protein DDY69_11855, partial [Deltaproteobacteria bacterium]|nr:hypothetical protein [Deltaproteobacteria bacterium]
PCWKRASYNRSEKLLVLFHEKPCGCHHKSDNYLLILLNNIIIQQVIDIFFCNQINCFSHCWEKNISIFCQAINI